MEIKDCVTFEGKMGVILDMLDDGKSCDVVFDDGTHAWYDMEELVRGVPIVHANGCRYPLWGDGAPVGNVCNNPLHLDYDYCKNHVSVCYVRMVKK